MKSTRIALPILGIVILSLSMSCRSDKTEAPAPASVSVIPVTTVSVARQRISEKATYTGTLEAWRKINITPEIGGKVVKIHAEEGQRVQKDQLLAELDTESVRLQLKQAEAALAVAEANLRNADKNRERMDRLLVEKAVTEQQSEQVKLGYDAAKAQFDQAQAGVNLARHALDVSMMRAPFGGIVASKNTEVGEVINPMMGGYSPGGGGVLTLVDYSRIKIGVDVSLSDIVRIEKGRPAIVRAGDEAKTYPGTVTVVNATADPLSKKFHCEVMVENPSLTLRPGTFGSVVFEIHSRDGALVIPQKAVLGGTHVFLLQGGKAVKREVALGLKNTLLVEVTAGLKEGDQVIVEGNFGLMDGTPVEIKK